MRVLVTGATGFIGNYVIQALLRRDIDVVATSQNADRAARFSWYPDVTYRPYDINSRQADLHAYFERPDKLLHLAWAGLPNYDLPFHFEEQTNQHYQFLLGLLQSGLEDMTVAGTCFEYGLTEGALGESLPARPVTAYGLAKDTLRRYLAFQSGRLRFRLRWVRLFYLNGRGQNDNALLPQLERAVKSGSPVFNMSPGDQLRDYLPVETAADYLVRIAAQEEVLGIINCCSGCPVSIRELVEKRLRELGANIELNRGHYPYAEYEPLAFWGDRQKLDLALEASG